MFLLFSVGAESHSLKMKSYGSNTEFPTQQALL